MSLTLSLPSTSYLPGETIEGNVSWESNRKTPKYIIVRLLWVTQGKGTPNSMVMAQEKIERPNPSGSQDFRLLLPQFPWSYEGKLISLQWRIEAASNVHKTQSTPIICAPNHEAIHGHPVKSSMTII